jgi:RNA polymerase sigma-70 factor (ECF subfamily)
VERARKGDQEALRHLLEEVTPAVQQWAMALCRNPDDAADLTQDVLILVVRKLPSFRGNSRFLSWLYTVTRNQGMDALRRYKRQERRMERFEARLPLETALPSVPGSEMDGNRIRELVRAFLEELPERQRQVFQLSEMQGFTSTDISQILGIRPGGVRAALHKARKAMRGRILEQHPELVEEYLA